MLATGQRRRLGAWLLLGWAAFWLTAVIQPCCSRFAATSGSDKPSSLVHATDPVAHHAESSSLPSRPDNDCPDLSAIGPGMPNAATTVTDRLDFLMMAPSVPLLLKPYDDARAFLTSNVPHPPPSGAPLYLRTQRFRI
jgi:hypothetical protein